MKRKVLAKQTESFKIIFDKNAILKYISTSTSVYSFGGDLLNFLTF